MSELAGLYGQDPPASELTSLYGGPRRRVEPPAPPTGTTLFRGVSPERFGTSYQPTMGQLRNEMGAMTEYSNRVQEFAGAGQLDAFREREKDRSDPGLMSTLTKPVFDLLSIGNYTIAGAAQEFVRTGNAWEAFKQASREFANALPAIEIAKARRATWADVLREEGPGRAGLPVFSMEGNGRWSSAAVGLLLDIFTDPLTYTGYGTVYNFLGKGAKLMPWSDDLARGLKASPLYQGTADILGRTFVKDYDLAQAERALEKGDLSFGGVDVGYAKVGQLKDEGKGSIRAYRETLLLADAALSRRQMHWKSVARRLTAQMTEREHYLLGEFMGAGEHVLDKALTEAAQRGQFTPERAEQLRQFGRQYRKVYDQWRSELLDTGVLDKGQWIDNYMYGIAPVTPRHKRTMDKLMEERGITPRVDAPAAPSELFGVKSDPTMAYQRRYPTLNAALADGYSRELHLGSNVAAYGFHANRAMANRELVTHVLQNPEISRKLVSELSADGLKMAQDKGYELFKVGWAGVEGSYLMPKVIVDHLSRLQQAFTQPEEITRWGRAFDYVNGLWKGLAVLSPGFHARNSYSNMWLMWNEGVGDPASLGKTGAFTTANIPAVFRRLSARVSGSEDPRTANFFRLHAASIQLAAGSTDNLQPGFRQKIAAWLGVDDLSHADLKLPEIKGADGKALTPEQLSEEVQKYGVLNRGFVGSSDMMDIERQALREVTPAEGGLVGRVLGAGTKGDPNAVGLAYQMDMPGPNRERLAKWLGPANPVLDFNRAVGGAIENVAHVMTYLDGRIKGLNPYDAAMRVKQVLYDYTQLSDTERVVFKRVMPFYSWARKNTVRMWQSLVMNPGRASRMPKVINAIESLSPEWESIDKPDYFDEIAAIRLPLIRDGKPIYWNPNLPYVDINRLNYRDVISNLNPFAKVAIEAAFGGKAQGDRGYSLFLGREIERYEGEESEVLPLSKTADTNLRTLLPPVGKTLRLVEKAKRGELMEQLLTEGMGIKVIPVDTRRVLRGKRLAKSRVAREFKDYLQDEGRL